jgi:hypothetical protein
MKMEGSFFEHSVPVPSLKILNFANFFCVFSTSFVTNYKNSKSLENYFFYANMPALVFALFIQTMLLLTIEFPRTRYL